MQLTGRSQIRNLILAQFGASILIALLLLLVSGIQAKSALAGGLIAASTNGLSALKAFARYRAQEPGKVLARLYGAELQKLLLTALLFAVAVISLHPLSVGALLGAYLLVQVLVPLIVLYVEDRLKTR
jgi:ATP synthase protein I